MCLINFHVQNHPLYHMIVAANRDESYERPTEPAHFWKDKPYLLAGRDRLQNGTWLGVTKQGRFAALTNYRDPEMEQKSYHSRGEIVVDFLESNISAQQFLRKLQSKKDDYAGFNVIAGDINGLSYYSNVQNQIVEIEPGTHGLSNAFLNTSWPKVEEGKKRLAHEADKNEVISAESLFTILMNEEPAADEHLPYTGVELEIERLLSPLFIRSENYGTRSSTVLLIDKQHRVTLIERTYRLGQFVEDRHFTFDIESM